MGTPLERRFVSGSPEETRAFARALAEALPERAILLLVGPLGVGKTTFVRGLAEGLGIPAARVRSPSYLVMLRYRGRKPLLHVDLYRREAPEWDIVEEILEFPGIVAVEWGEKVAPYLEDYLRVEMRFREENREIQVQAVGRQLAGEAESPGH